MREGRDLETETGTGDAVDDAEPRPDEATSLYSLTYLVCSIGFLVVLLGGLGYLLYRAATIEERIPSGWYWAVAMGCSVLGAPLFLSDEKNPSSVRRLGRHLTRVVGVAAVAAALVAIWLVSTGGLRMLTGVEWAGILLIALAVNVIERRQQSRKTRRTES
jgi:hypothetical protein